MAERHVAGDQLSAFLDDELRESDALRVARHLADCETCLAELGALRSTRDALRRLPLLQAPVLTGGVASRSQQSTQVVRRVKLAVLAVTVPAAVLSAVYVLGGDDGDLEPSTELLLVEHLGRTVGGPVPVAVGDDEG